jgi:DNA polymerase
VTFVPAKGRAVRKNGPSPIQVILDLETRSALDLRQVPAVVYAAHRSTSLLCVAWQVIGEAKIYSWIPGSNTPALVELHRRIAAGVEVLTWSDFDRVVWNAVQTDWPPILLEQHHDIAARAAMCGLPRGLEKCAAALRIADTKDKAGRNALRYLMRPRSWSPDGEPVFADDTERLALLRTYNVQDIRLTAKVASLLPPLPDEERAVWLHDQRVAARGFGIDPNFLAVAGPFLVQAQRDGDAQMRTITNGKVGSVSAVKALADWLGEQGVDLRVNGTDDDEHDGNDAEPAGRRGQLSKSAIRALLERPGLPTAARMALETRQDCGRSSTAKIVALAGAVSSDNRLRGSLLYHGTLTGRQTAKLFQPQNLPRDSYSAEDWPVVFADMQVLGAKGFREKYSSPMAALVRLLRGAIVPAAGHELAIGDFSRIELCVLAWLADQSNLLADLRAGKKIYDSTAARIYGVPIAECTEGEKYNFGKMTALACGYGLGWRALTKQAREQYDLVIDEPLAHTAVDTYRTTWPRIPDLWRELEAAAFDALAMPGTTFPVCDERAALKVTHDRQWLGLQLPSGRWIRLHQPKVILDDRNGCAP